MEPSTPEHEARAKRKRMKTTRYDVDDILDNKEQKLIQQALKNSQRDSKRVDYDIPEAPTFYPTIEQFKDPLAYIKSITPDAKTWGICKIVPPDGWEPPMVLDFNHLQKVDTKRQEINTLQEGQGFDSGESYTIRDYHRYAEDFFRDYKSKFYQQSPPTYRDLERDYWKVVETNCQELAVDYANDIDVMKYQSGFINRPSSFTDGCESADCQDMFSEDYYSRTGWNLLNIARSRGSILKHIHQAINGVNVPWLYIGMLFASFCWHNEDNYLYSINYSHFGSIKQWYGVPGDQAKQFEKITKDFLLESFKEAPDLLHHMTMQISPSLLYANGLNVCQVKQTPKSFVITFPKAFHGGFSYGFNVGEAVNFALEDWISVGSEAEERYRIFARPSVFSHHRLLFTLLMNCSNKKKPIGDSSSSAKANSSNSSNNENNSNSSNNSSNSNNSTSSSNNSSSGDKRSIFDGASNEGNNDSRDDAGNDSNSETKSSDSMMPALLVNYVTSLGADADEDLSKVGSSSSSSVVAIKGSGSDGSKQLYDTVVYDLLVRDILKILDEEMQLRPRIYGAGVRNISSIVKLAPNDFSSVNEAAFDLDDARSCEICKYVCVLSAVACECSQTKVACLRHHSLLCKCPKSNQYMLEWMSMEEIQANRRLLHRLLDKSAPARNSLVAAVAAAAAAAAAGGGNSGGGGGGGVVVEEEVGVGLASAGGGVSINDESKMSDGSVSDHSAGDDNISSLT